MKVHASERTIADQAIEALRAALNDKLVSVVLFGSRARGEERADSDWDLLVIAEELPDKPFERHLFLKRLLPAPCRGAMSMLAKTPAEFEQRVVPLYLDIALDGQILYDPLRYATDRLSALRRMMEKTGLQREHTMAGDMWRYASKTNRPPALRWE